MNPAPYILFPIGLPAGVIFEGIQHLIISSFTPVGWPIFPSSFFSSARFWAISRKTPSAKAGFLNFYHSHESGNPASFKKTLDPHLHGDDTIV